MDLSKLTMGQKLVLGGGVVLLVASFLPWYSVFGFSINGWDAGFLAWFGILVGIAAAVVVALKAFGVTDFKGAPLTAEQMALALGAGSAALILLRLLTETSAVSFGLFLGLAAAAVIAFGAFQSSKEVGAAPPAAGPPAGPPGGPPG